MAFNSGQSINSTISSASTTFGAAASAVSYAGKVAGNLQQNLLSSAGLSAGAEVVGDILSAVSSFKDTDNGNDWRVRLSLPTWSSFKKSPVLKPLVDAGGLIFPYTPTITMASTAKYSSMPVTHTNYAFQAYESSSPGRITITAPMNVHDTTEALYWIAAVHYLRSVTKMFTGYDPKAGNPPPLVFLNAYGNYVFKNVPVAVVDFQTSLSKDCDYIGTDVVGTAMGNIAGIADSVGGLADSIGGTIPQISGITNTISSIAGGVGQVSSLLGTFGIGGTTSGGVSYVPTKSDFTVILQPIYSRESMRNFSLDRFVQGGYINNTFGYI